MNTCQEQLFGFPSDHYGKNTVGWFPREGINDKKTGYNLDCIILVLQVAF